MASLKYYTSVVASISKVYSITFIRCQSKPLQRLPFLLNNTIKIRPIVTSPILNAEAQEKETILHITEACIEQLKKVTTPGEFLRLSVEGGGCSGFSYKFDLDTEMQDDDVCFNQDGVQVVSDETSLEFIKGSTVDYEVELIKSAFSVKNNPKSSTKCSCGVSFAID